jgi:hypothetical protein
MDIHQARTEAMHEMTDTNQKEVIEIRAWRKLMKACLERTKATDLEAKPKESEHLEVPKEDATMETIGALEVQHPAIGSRLQMDDLPCHSCIDSVVNNMQQTL